MDATVSRTGGKRRARMGTLPVFSPRNLGRYPRLDTLLMVEQELFEHKSDKTITQIWKLLPKKVMWATYTTILDYLEYSGKIRLEEDKTVSWLWNPEGVRKVLGNPRLVVRRKRTGGKNSLALQRNRSRGHLRS